MTTLETTALLIAGLFASEAVPEADLASGVSSPGERDLIPRQVLFGNPERIAVQISPDGSHIGYIAPYRDVLNIFVRPVDGDEARPVTSFTDRPVSGFSWAWNSEQLLFGRDTAGDENTHLFAANINGSPPVDLTPIDGVKAMVVESERDRPDEVVIGLNDRDPRHHDYYILNTRTGDRTPLLMNEEGYLGYLFTSDWTPRGRLSMTPEGGLKAEMKDDQGWYEFMNIGMEDSMTTQPLGFGADDRFLYGLDSRGRDTAALVVLPAERGGGARPDILFSSDRADVTGTLTSPLTKKPEAVLIEYLRPEWTALDPAVEGDLKALESLDEGSFMVTSRTADDRVWTVAYRQDAGPVRYWIWDRDAGSGEFLFTHRSDLDAYDLRPMEPVEITTRDGLVMPSYLTRPSAAAGPVPMVLLVHGGPWARDTWGFNPLHQWLADRGYAVLSPNFRGSTGFGKSFINAGNREWYAAMQDDLVDATQWAIDQGIADPDRIAIMGGSYGGYATLAALTRDPELFAAGIDIVGPSHVATLLQTIPPYWEPMKKMFETRVGSLEEPEFLDSISPLHHVDRITRPLLIVQGANDPRVKISESDQIVAAMNERGLPVTYLVYPDEGHGLVRPENRMAFNAVTEEFLAKHLGGRMQPMGDEVPQSSAQIRDKGNLELAGVEVWIDDGSSRRPVEEEVDRDTLSAEELQKIDMAMAQLNQLPSEQLPGLLNMLESQRATVPVEDLRAFDFMVQEVRRLIDQQMIKSP